MTGSMQVERPAPSMVHALTRELSGWLETPDVGRIARMVGGWSPQRWSHFASTVVIQGVAPHLNRDLERTGLRAVLPDTFRAWLADEAGRNELRVRALQADLAAVLAAASQVGIGVMPLKGALLTSLDPDRVIDRPMADLDLLVRPADASAMGLILRGLGYELVPENNPRPTHAVYVRPGERRVAGLDGEHPDNPRPVEVHVEVKRHLWGWADDDDLTPAMWARSAPGTILGQPAILPAIEDLLAHLAIHATSDLLNARGRLVQWLDLTQVAPRAGRLGDLPHPRLAYPSLGLARRALPIAMAGVDLVELEQQVPRRLAAWVDRVPFDGRCGLSGGEPPDRPATMRMRWRRWAPIPWRLLVAYGDTPRAVALGRHAALLADRLARRVSTSHARAATTER